MKFWRVIIATLFATLTLCGCAKTGEVKFMEGDLGRLFNDERNKIFNYCPSILQDGEERYVYYCSNDVSGLVFDHVYVRKGTKNRRGKWVYSQPSVALAPTKDAFDDMHCCDPTVIKGEFKLNDQTYTYLMAYTGNSTSVDNKVGLAVSNSPMEGWVKVSDKPFIDLNLGVNYWGIGQPSLIYLGEGKALLFCAVGSYQTYSKVFKYDFSNLNQPVMMEECDISAKGLLNLNGGQDYMTNGDFAYDSVNKRLYCISDCHPNPQDGFPSFVGGSFRVTYIPFDIAGQLNQLAMNRWSTLITIGPGETGFARNSNCGIVTDGSGYTLSSSEMETMYSVSEAAQVDNFWLYTGTYRIHGYNILIKE